MGALPARRVHLLYSVSKSFTATALGFALAEGRLSLSDPIVDLFGDLGETRPIPGSGR